MPLLKRAVFLFVMSVLTGCTSFMFQPLPQHYITPDVMGVMHEDVFIKTSDGLSLHGWKLLAEGDSKGTVLYFHGNAENISTHFGNVYWLPEQGYDVYLFDYRGYGKSEGIPELHAIMADMETMIAYTVKQLPENENIALIGHSLGGGLAIHAVAHSQQRDRIGVLITAEAFSDYHDVAQDVLSIHWLTWLFQWPLSFTVDNSYRPLDAVGKITPIQLVLIHSKTDEIIPFDHAESLYEAASEPKTLKAINSDHNHVFNAPENRQLLLDLLGRYK